MTQTHLTPTLTGSITREAAWEAAKQIDAGAQYVRTEVRGRRYIFDTGWGTPEFAIEAATRVWVDAVQRSK